MDITLQPPLPETDIAGLHSPEFLVFFSGGDNRIVAAKPERLHRYVGLDITLAECCPHRMDSLVRDSYLDQPKMPVVIADERSTAFVLRNFGENYGIYFALLAPAGIPDLSLTSACGAVGVSVSPELRTAKRRKKPEYNDKQNEMLRSACRLFEVLSSDEAAGGYETAAKVAGDIRRLAGIVGIELEIASLADEPITDPRYDGELARALAVIILITLWRESLERRTALSVSIEDGAAEFCFAAELYMEGELASNRECFELEKCRALANHYGFSFFAMVEGGRLSIRFGAERTDWSELGIKNEIQLRD